VRSEKLNQQPSKEFQYQAVMFFIFSISAGVIQAISFTLLYEIASWVYWPSYLIALTLSVIWNFTLNRKFTFKSANNIPIAMTKVAFFYLIFTPLSTWWGDALESIGWNGYLILGLTMITNLVTEFIYTKYFVYHQGINTAVKTS
jgi:putative flippase GtrA